MRPCSTFAVATIAAGDVAIPCGDFSTFYPFSGQTATGHLQSPSPTPSPRCPMLIMIGGNRCLVIVNVFRRQAPTTRLVPFHCARVRYPCPCPPSLAQPSSVQFSQLTQLSQLGVTRPINLACIFSSFLVRFQPFFAHFP